MVSALCKNYFKQRLCKKWFKGLENKGGYVMGKMKEWLIQMKEDASELTRSQWIEVHGASNVWVYDYEQGVSGR